MKSLNEKKIPEGKDIAPTKIGYMNILIQLADN